MKVLRCRLFVVHSRAVRIVRMAPHALLVLALPRDLTGCQECSGLLQVGQSMNYYSLDPSLIKMRIRPLSVTSEADEGWPRLVSWYV